jgi:hypothetical protein
MFYSYETVLPSVFLKRACVVPTLLVLVFSLPASTKSNAQPFTVFDFNTEGQTTCGSRENLTPTDNGDRFISDMQRGVALACEDGVDDVFGNSGFGTSFDSTRSASFTMYNQDGYSGLVFSIGDTLSFNAWRTESGPTEGRVLLTLNDNDTTLVVGTFPITSTPTTQTFTWPEDTPGAGYNPGCESTASTKCVLNSARVSFQARFSDEMTTFTAFPKALYLDNVALEVSERLPVELTHFTASASGGRAAALRWQTASETGNDGFRVERRTSNTDDWQRAGFVESKAASGTSQQTLSYQFRAEGLQPGTHAFRLRQKDIDGDTEVHGPVRVEVGLGARFLLKAPYPNPARAGEAATVRFASRQGERVRVALHDARGRRVRALYRGAPAAGQLESVRIGGLDGLASGTYFVRLTAGDGSVTKTQALTLVR